MVGRMIPRCGSERLFHVLWKTAVAQGQVGGTTQTEFVICDQSIDTNHGYGKRPIVNSEVAKKRAVLEKRLRTIERWMASARVRSHKASLLYDRLWNQTKAYGDERYRKLNAHQDALAAQGVDYDERRAQIKAEKAGIDAELEQRWQRAWRAYNTSSKESEKQQRYAHEQGDLL
jgi:hypothetical protein